MQLKIKFLKWSAGIPVSMLNEKTAEKIGAHILSRILIKKGSKKIVTIVDTIGNLVKENEIAVSSELKDILDLNSGDKLEVSIAQPPRSMIFIKDKLIFTKYPELFPNWRGFHLYYSTHKSPASVPTELLYSIGQNYLTADILGTKLKFGLLSFFQINIPIFTRAVKDIAAFIGPKDPVLDFYSGVGAISLPLARNRVKTTLVEISSEAVEYAKNNIILNSIHIHNQSL